MKPSTDRVGDLVGDVEPCVSQEPTVLAAGWEIKEEVEVGGFAFLKFENPYIMQVAAEFAFDAVL